MWWLFVRRRRTTLLSWSFLRYDPRRMALNWAIAFSVLILIKLWFLIPAYIVLFFVSHAIAKTLHKGPYASR